MVTALWVEGLARIFTKTGSCVNCASQVEVTSFFFSGNRIWCFQSVKTSNPTDHRAPETRKCLLWLAIAKDSMLICTVGLRLPTYISYHTTYVVNNKVYLTFYFQYCSG
jgi:hypothetical protein